MKVSLFEVPYHMGQERVGMGLGPARLLEQGADRLLRNQGCEVHLETIERQGTFAHEIVAIQELNNLLAGRVRVAVEENRFPLVLAGNCNSCLGTLAGLSPRQIGIIWFDAHGDFNTPETTQSGLFEGMPLAIATGRCWTELAAKLLHFRPIPEERVLLVGVRDLDPGERALLEHSQVGVVEADRIRERGLPGALEPALDELASRVGGIYLHIDIDVLDPSQAPANEYSAPGGLSPAELEQALGMVARRFAIRAAALTAYNPDYDREGKTARVGLDLIRLLVSAATARS